MQGGARRAQPACNLEEIVTAHIEIVTDGGPPRLLTSVRRGAGVLGILDPQKEQKYIFNTIQHTLARSLAHYRATYYIQSVHPEDSGPGPWI